MENANACPVRMMNDVLEAEEHGRPVGSESFEEGSRETNLVDYRGRSLIKAPRGVSE
jgi:hypothetical protein